MWRTPDAAASLSSDLPCAPWVCQVCTMILGGGHPTTNAMIEQRRRLDEAHTHLLRSKWVSPSAAPSSPTNALMHVKPNTSRPVGTASAHQVSGNRA